MPKSKRGTHDYADELRAATADELELPEDASPGEELLGVGRAIVFALQEVAARLDILEDAIAKLQESLP